MNLQAIESHGLPSQQLQKLLVELLEKSTRIILGTETVRIELDLPSMRLAACRPSALYRLAPAKIRQDMLMEMVSELLKIAYYI